MRVTCLGVVCLVAGSLLLSAQCQAQGTYAIKPLVKTGIEYNSNFWKFENDEVSVNTYTIMPGFEFGYQTPKLDVELDATVNFYWYDDQDTPPLGILDASDNDYTGFTGEFSSAYKASDRLLLTLDDDLYVTRDPTNADILSDSISREKYTVNYFQPGVFYEFADKFGLEVKYRNAITEYDEDDIENNKENRGIFDLYYYLNSSSSVFLDYSVWERKYDEDSSDYLSNVVTLNYKHLFNYFSILAGGGYNNRDFDLRGIEDTEMFSWNIDIVGKDADTTRKTTKSYLYLTIGQEPNDDTTGDEFYKASFMRFESAYKFLHNLEGTLRVEYLGADYEYEDIDEDTWKGAIGLSYRPSDNFTLGLVGGAEDRDSNVVGGSYDDTFIMLTLDIDYDIGGKHARLGPRLWD